MTTTMATGSLRWYHIWCEPIAVALIEKDVPAIERGFVKAQRAVAANETTELEANLLKYQLAYLSYQANGVIKSDTFTTVELPRIIALFEDGGQNDGAEGLRSRLYIQLRICLDNSGWRALSAEELSDLLAALPAGEKILELYSYVANWAFRHEHLGLLEESCGFAVSQGRAFSASWIWRRSDVMMRLLRKDATKTDIDYLIEDTKLPYQFKVIRKLIWPKAAELSLIDARMEQELSLAEQQAQAHFEDNFGSAVRPHIGSPDRSRRG